MISPSISQAIIKMTPWPFLFMTLGTDWQVFFNQQLADNWLKEMNTKSNVPQTLSFAQLAQLSTMWRNSNVDGWWLAVVGCILELGKVRPVVLVFVPSIEIYSCNVQLQECYIREWTLLSLQTERQISNVDNWKLFAGVSFCHWKVDDISIYHLWCSLPLPMI